VSSPRIHGNWVSLEEAFRNGYSTYKCSRKTLKRMTMVKDYNYESIADEIKFCHIRTHELTGTEIEVKARRTRKMGAAKGTR